MEVWQLIVIGVGVHAVVFFSMFDLYFTTPLVHGMTGYKARGPAPAKRLVLFVGDGMRADTLFGLNESGKPNAPFLRKVIEEKGAWGVSHGRGPTESRPSHVALVAGFFEDVSCVKKKWEENAEPYDSVFNQSRHTWAWGCPTVVRMFSKVVKEVPITASSFGSIADPDYAKMDPWVFTRVKEFFAGAAKDEKKRRVVAEDRLVFFLHLDSSDASGHENLPHSRKYAQTIGIVDEGVRTIADMIDQFFKDDSTAYVLTGDHGMSDRGKHGDNSPQELETPVVAWGAGVRGPEVVEKCGDYLDGYCPNSKLNHRSRQDVQQKDLAPLMAYLVGLNYPANSMGELPVSFLDAKDEQKAEAMYANAQQMIAQFLVKMANVKNRTFSATFRPFRFKGLPNFYQKPDISTSEDSWPEQSDTSDPMILLRNIRNLIDKGRYKDAITESQLVVRATVRGFRYYHTYDRTFLGLSVTLGFLGWMGCVLLSMFTVYTPASCHPPKQSPARARRQLYCVICSLFGTAGIVTATLLYIQGVPRTYYCYALLPVFLWMKLALRWRDVQHVARKAVEHGMLRPVLGLLVLVALGVLFVVLCFSYREMISVGLILMALWVVTTPAFVSHKKTCMGWMLSCAVLAVFPLLQPVWRSTCFELVILSGVVASSVGFFLTFRISRSQPSVSASPRSRGVHFVQVVLVAMTTLVVGVMRYNVDLFSFLTNNRQWLLGASFLCPLLTDVNIHVRLFSLCLALLLPFLLMSITYETFFFLSLMCLLYFWLRIERHLSQPDKDETDLPTSFGAVLPFLSQRGDRRADRFLHFDDLRLAFFYLFLVIISFFGWTDIYSINNADSAVLKCLHGLFRSSVMDNLKYVKLALPFLMVTCVMTAVQEVSRIPFRALCMLITLMADSLGLTFLFLVRDFGTWRQVGTSITHYVISLVVGTAVVLTLMLCQVLTAFSLPSLVLYARARLLRAKRCSM